MKGTLIQPLSGAVAILSTPKFPVPGLPSIDELAAAGVRRISQGAAAFLATIGYLERTTKAFLDGEPLEFAGSDPPAVHLVPQLLYR